MYIPKVILVINTTAKMSGDGVFINHDITALFTINLLYPLCCCVINKIIYCEDTMFSIIRRKDPFMLNL